jgi:hypothetical protein
MGDFVFNILVYVLNPETQLDVNAIDCGVQFGGGSTVYQPMPRHFTRHLGSRVSTRFPHPKNSRAEQHFLTSLHNGASGRQAPST